MLRQRVTAASRVAARPHRGGAVRVVAAAASGSRPPTLLERMGGKPAVVAAVDIFYNKVLADQTVAHYFAHTDMAKQRSHQAQFLSYAMSGGAEAYNGKDMVTAHAHLLPHLEERHFNAIVQHLDATLTELGVPRADIDEALSVVATTKDDVLQAPERAAQRQQQQ